MAENADAQKRAAAAAALELVEDGMSLGLGTGSTMAHFIDLLGERVRAGLEIVGVPTSDDTARRAEASGVALTDGDEATAIDLAIDGADEIGPDLNLIKGGGGALLREKIVARAARRFVVVADETKRVRALGAFALPIEIVRAHYGLTARAVRDALRDHGLPSDKVSLRTGDGRGEGPFLTDNGGYVLDCALGRIDAPADLDAALRRLPGVVETGLFLGLADEAFVANAGGVARLGRG